MAHLCRDSLFMSSFAYMTEAQMSLDSDGPEDGEWIDPDILTDQIKTISKTSTIQVLLHTYHQYESDLNNVHLSDFWTSLGRLAGRPSQQL